MHSNNSNNNTLYKPNIQNKAVMPWNNLKTGLNFKKFDNRKVLKEKTPSKN